jgi:hypothetical protein
MLRRIVGLALVALLTLALAAPAAARRFVGSVLSGGVFLNAYPFPIPVRRSAGITAGFVIAYTMIAAQQTPNKHPLRRLRHRE